MNQPPAMSRTNERDRPTQPEPDDTDWTGFGPDGDGAALPWSTGLRPPRLLLTLLGDYWWRQTEPLPSAALVALLAEFGVSDSAARAASPAARCPGTGSSYAR